MGFSLGLVLDQHGSNPAFGSLEPIFVNDLD